MSGVAYGLLRLAVMFKPGRDALEADEVLAHLDASGLSRYDMPEYFLILDEIPLTASVS